MTRQTSRDYRRASRQTRAADLARPSTSVVLSRKSPSCYIGCTLQSVTVDPTDPWTLLFGEYWLPGVRRVTGKEMGDGSIGLVQNSNIVAGAILPNGRSVRLFPKGVPGADAKRLQCAVLLPNDDLLVSRNGEPEGQV